MEKGSLSDTVPPLFSGGFLRARADRNMTARRSGERKDQA
jgi:hypothetical protein